MPVEIAQAQPGDPGLADFWRATEREALETAWNFRVIWHEQTHDIVALDDDRIVGALHVRIAASLAHLERLVVVPAHRRGGIGRALVERCEEVANYYNCHKVTLQALDGAGAHRFFTACGYKTEAVLPQHTFKLDVAVLRKFLL